MLAGLSNRLGWEANAARERGRVLPELHDVGVDHGDGTTVYDGRLGHGIPTVVVVRDAVALWGAGSTLRRGVPPGTVRLPGNHRPGR